MNPEDQFMAEFIDHDWMVEEMNKGDEHLKDLIRFYKGKAPDPEQGWYSLSRKRFIFIGFHNSGLPVIDLGRFWTFYANNQIIWMLQSREVLTSKQDFGNLWIALNCI